jgi:hypothetical protein
MDCMKDVMKLKGVSMEIKIKDKDKETFIDSHIDNRKK